MQLLQLFLQQIMFPSNFNYICRLIFVLFSNGTCNSVIFAQEYVICIYTHIHIHIYTKPEAKISCQNNVENK